MAGPGLRVLQELARSAGLAPLPSFPFLWSTLLKRQPSSVMCSVTSSAGQAGDYVPIPTTPAPTTADVNGQCDVIAQSGQELGTPARRSWDKLSPAYHKGPTENATRGHQAHSWRKPWIPFCISHFYF